MIRLLTLITILQAVSFKLYSQQVGITRFMDASVFDGLNPFDYKKIEFSWNMQGQIQVEMNEGLNAMDQNNFIMAEAHFEKVLALDPSFGVAFYYRALCHKNNLKFNAAEYDLMQALKLFKNPECYIQLGDIYYLMRNFKLAKEYYEKAVKANPDLVNGYYKLGCLSINSQRVEESIRHFTKCNELDPGFVKSYLQRGIIEMRFKRDNQAANAFFTKAIHADSSGAQPYFWRGMTSLMERDRTGSLSNFNKAVERAPSNPYFRLIRGLLLVELKEFDNAFTDLRKALAITSISESHSQFGQTIFDKKIDLQNAMEYLNRELYGYDELSIEFLKIGFCYLLTGNFQEAIDNFHRVSRIKKTATETYLIALTFEHQGRHSMALSIYSDALELDPDIFDAYKKRAIYRGELKEWTGAFADVNQMRRLQPGSPVIDRLNGFLSYNYGDYSTAIKAMDVYLKNDSTDVEAIKIRADSKSHVKDYTGAISDFKRVLILTSENKQGIEDLLISNTLNAGDTVTAINLLIDYCNKYRLIASEILLSEVYIQSRDFKKAENRIFQLDRVLKTGYLNNPNRAYVFYLKSQLDSKQGHYEDALKQVNKSLNFKEEDIFRFLRAKILLQMNEVDKSKEDLKILKTKGFKQAEALYLKYGI